MAIKSFGISSSLKLKPDWNISNNGRGLLEGNAVFTYTHTDTVRPKGLPKRGDKHPEDDRLICWDTDQTYGKNRLGTVKCKYIGIETGDITLPEWTLSGQGGETSIQYHNKFKKWVTQAGNDITKIKRDDQGFFVAFGPLHPEVPALEKYLEPQGNCKVSFYCKSTSLWTKFSIGGLGKWCNKPPYAPQFLDASKAKLSWLLTGSSVQEYSSIYKVELDFTLSVQGEPHNKFVYNELTGK